MEIRDNLTLFYDFYLVAKEKSFSKAAEINNMASSNLSRGVKTLEEHLKLKLINSNNKGIQLTIDGERLYNKLDAIFSNLSSFISNISGNSDDDGLTGNIRIGTTRNIADNFLEKFLTDFHKKYPNIKISIIIDSAKNINDFLLEHKIDVLIDYMQQINFSQKYDINTVALGNFETCFASSKEFYQKNGANIKSLKDLKNYDLVFSGASRRRQMLDSLLHTQKIEFNAIAEMPDSQLMADFIKSNNCIGYFIKEEVKNYDLVEITLNEEMPKNDIGISYNKNTINNVTEKFIKLVLSE